MGITVSVRSNINRVVAGMRADAREVVEQAVPRALNRVIEMARTQAARDLRADGYAIKASEWKGAVQLVRASRGKRGARMRVPRLSKSLMEFSPRETKDGVVVKIHGAPALIRGAFIGQLQNGRLGVYIEDKTAGKTILRRSKQHKRGSVGGWQAYPVRKLYGPSLGGMFVNRQVQATLDRFVSQRFEERLRHEVKRILA